MAPTPRANDNVVIASQRRGDPELRERKLQIKPWTGLQHLTQSFMQA